MREDLIGRLGQREAILHVRRHERRYVERLAGGRMKVAPSGGRPQPVVVRAAKGVVHLRHHQAQARRAIEAIEERYRVEAVAQVAQVGQQEDPAVGQLDVLPSRVGRQPLAQRRGGRAEVIAVVEARPVPPVVAGESRHRHQFRNAVHVEEGHERPVGEGVRHRGEAAVAERAGVDRGRDHQRTPSDVATRTAELKPSS